MSKIKEAYVTMQRECGIKKDDKVKVLRAVGTNFMGWNGWWGKCKDNCVGRTLVVRHVDDDTDGIRLYTNGSDDNNSHVEFFPFFILEKIEPITHPITLANGKIVHISDESYQEMAKHAE